MALKSEFAPISLPTEAYGETALNALWAAFVEEPEKPIFVDSEDYSKSVTFKTVYFQSLAVSSYLDKINFRHGDVACLVMPNCFEYFPISTGIALIGGTSSGASYMFTEYGSLDRVLNVAKRCPFIKKIVASSESQDIREFPFGVTNIKDVFSTQPNVNRQKIDINLDRDICILPYSSGTTGVPKGVMLTHRNFGTMMKIYLSHFEYHINQLIYAHSKPQDDVYICTGPMYHVAGWSLLNLAVLMGQTCVIFNKFSPHSFCKAVQVFKPKVLRTVPPIVVLLAKSSIVDRYDLSSIKLVAVGAAPTGKELCEDLMKRHPTIRYVTQGYGMTETTTACHLHVLLEDDQKFGNSGKVANNMEMMIWDPETKKELQQFEKGEICLRGPLVMLGYLNRPEATAQSIDDHGWLHTGDIDYVDKEGFLYVVDRLKELIKVKGLQVPPAELEDLLLTHPEIADAGVVGILDDRDGEHPIAFVVTKNENLTEKEVQDFVKDRVAKYKQLIGGVVFIKEIPKSAAGKILRRYLKDEAIMFKNAREKSHL
ncbi:hypothetical protein L596_021069 [Steinernema carpocapsae]|uniref:Uncharacterized protein n=1 Tax=Steinernema carpocapsae TaxID=34508 RepID=A0A4U5MVF2_STECR|nr:hypothetical protein L596_021069 [Steinernema carpocapsae]